MTENKDNYYNVSASKGFSYLIPYTAQDVLKKLLKQLPAAARTIYRGYYGDVMASRACTQDSANAMVKFVQESFPKISKNHNKLARIMNTEIDKDWHSYIPVKMPIVADVMGSDLDEEAKMLVQAPQTRKKNDAATGPRIPKVSRIATTPVSDTQEAPLILSPPESIAGAEAWRKAKRANNVENINVPEPWDDLLWPHGPWVDGLEVIDKIPKI
ncbi:hypothetical protein DDE83_007271 [Stemphylium lycopersici]|uniref:Uncharacterized protein n=1 Tax=Stemphylium lycopersici TaxID=183478 RepID=A0A364MWG9_STELY|nr:hypothetical protein DDE83_007271 [Stemphylium lycopersici]